MSLATPPRPTPPLAEAPRLRDDALSRVLAVARMLSASDDLQQILAVIIDAMRDSLHAERATVFEYDPSTNELFSTVAHGFLDPSGGIEATGEIRIPATAGIAGQAAQTRRIINVPDAYADPRFNQAIDKKTGFRTRSILTIPLEAFGEELMGVAQVLNKRPANPGEPQEFTAADEEIATALASQAGVAMKRARLLEDRLVKEKLERDLELARKVQQQSFPSRVPAVEGYDIAGFSRPADQTGGDAYDMVGYCVGAPGSAPGSAHANTHHTAPIIDEGSDCSPTHALLFIADATGHGIGPALSATQARSMLRMGVRVGASLTAIAEHINRQLCADLPSGRFVTAWMATLDSTTHTLTSFSGGQAPLLHFKAATNEVDSHSADAMPLGIADPIDPEPRDFGMCVGDVFAVLSDGFYEALRAAHEGGGEANGEQFGEARMMALLREHAGLPAREIIDVVRDALEEFTGGASPADDQTALIVKRVR